MNTFALPIAGLPRTCMHCGRECDHWPLAPFAGQVALTCPVCFSRIGRVVAVPADNDTVEEPETTAQVVPGGLRVAYAEGSDRP